MDWRARCAAVIPCLNEAHHIEGVVRGVLRHLRTVYVVDDGSTDCTAARAAAAGAEVFRHPTPLGKGASLLAGWERAKSTGFEWVLMLDGDGQHDPDDIPAFLECAESTQARLVVGNRMGDPRAMPLIRRLVNWWMSNRLSKVAGRPLPDTQCGFRLMDVTAWQSLRINAAHFEIESELLLTFIQAGFRVESVPIRVIYGDERSKISPVRDTVRWFRWWRSRSRGPAAPGPPADSG